MTDKIKTETTEQPVYLTDLINNFLVSANGFRAVGVEASEESYRELMQKFCKEIGLPENIFDHVELDPHLYEAKALPVEVSSIREEATKPELTLV